MSYLLKFIIISWPFAAPTKEEILYAAKRTVLLLMRSYHQPIRRLSLFLRLNTSEHSQFPSKTLGEEMWTEIDGKVFSVMNFLVSEEKMIASAENFCGKDESRCRAVRPDCMGAILKGTRLRNKKVAAIMSVGSMADLASYYESIRKPTLWNGYSLSGDSVWLMIVIFIIEVLSI